MTKDKETKENKGFAFVTFTDKDAAQRAIEDLQDREYKVVWLTKMLNFLHDMGFLVLSCMMRLHEMPWWCRGGLCDAHCRRQSTGYLLGMCPRG